MKITKIFTLLLAFLSMHAVADYDHEYTAVNAAAKMLREAGCLLPQTRRVDDGRFKVGPLEGWQVAIRSRDIIVVCVEKSANVTATWEPPTQRDNGAPLPASQIAGYVMTLDGVDIKIGNVNNYLIRDAPEGQNELHLRTIDNNGFLSERSEIVSFEIKF